MLLIVKCSGFGSFFSFKKPLNVSKKVFGTSYSISPFKTFLNLKQFPFKLLYLSTNKWWIFQNYLDLLPYVDFKGNLGVLKLTPSKFEVSTNNFESEQSKIRASDGQMSPSLRRIRSPTWTFFHRIFSSLLSMKF